MAFKSGLIVGFGTGYVLGTKAGRERYDQIRAMWHTVTGSPAVQRATEKAKEAAATGTQRGLSLIQTGVGRTGSAVRTRLRRGDETVWNGGRSTPGSP
ncbi:MAG TPA: YtxH domain-containing protein [Actinomycetota bacterium]|nr:YtxH domain-containing protein [Actinomycetota bacterium]